MTADEAAEVDGVLSALAGGRPAQARLLLHPYLHWTTADGAIVRGRTRVLALLERDAAAQAAAAEDGVDVELRDGQIYRWTPRR